MATRLGVVFLFVLIPALPIEVFRARTVFREDEIRHLPKFGRWRTFRCQDIVDLEVFRNECAQLNFRDGRTLKIWAMRTDPLTVEGIIRRKWRPQQAIWINHAEGQSPTGKLKKLSQTEHRGAENFKKNHPNTGQRPGQIDRSRFKQRREQYWKDKVKKPDEP
ncbi:MAG: hypothetical protein H7039_12435 [Bryobacteraceae bacterium]|nr:hypothetical protein [Bryobacteraceae bacterium]